MGQIYMIYYIQFQLQLWSVKEEEERLTSAVGWNQAAHPHWPTSSWCIAPVYSFFLPPCFGCTSINHLKTSLRMRWQSK